MAMHEMLRLMQTAQKFVMSAGTNKCTWFYRNKYFDKIKSEYGEVTKAYLKDATGDLRAPINGEINFMPEVQLGEPQPQSPFGNTRVGLLVRADVFLSLASNFYFADFYCINGKEKDHYVTLVLTRLRSDADRLCQQRLPKLNIYDRLPVRFCSTSAEKFAYHLTSWWSCSSLKIWNLMSCWQMQARPI